MHRATSSTNHGFRGLSRIEVVVVIGMIAVVAAMLAPAVRRARESTHPVTGRDRLRRFGVAISQYESIFKSLPQGGSSGPVPQAKAAATPRLDDQKSPAE